MTHFSRRNRTFSNPLRDRRKNGIITRVIPPTETFKFKNTLYIHAANAGLLSSTHRRTQDEWRAFSQPSDRQEYYLCDPFIPTRKLTSTGRFPRN